MHYSKFLFFITLSFICGVFVSSFFSFSIKILYLLFLTPLLSLIFLRKNKLKFFLFIFFFQISFLFGFLRYQIEEFNFISSDLRTLTEKNKEIEFLGLVVREPDIRDKYINLFVRVEDFLSEDLKKLGFNKKELILVKSSRYPEYKYGDYLIIKGRLELPLSFEDFDYQGFLKKEGVVAQIFWPKIQISKEGGGNFFLRKIFSFKKSLRESINSNLPYPHSSILSAMILGDKSQLSNDIKNKLNITGVRHITAISGLHITILSAFLLNLFLFLGFWRKTAIYFSIFVMIIFIIMTGLQPSAIRAGIMGGLFLIAQILGRSSPSSNSIFLTAFAMLIFNPFLLRYDVGFQLSFLAMMGIIYFMPFLQKKISFIPESYIPVKDTIAMTLSAYIFTLPILTYNFGYVSLVSLLANVLIVPFLYPIMVLGLGAILLSLIFGILGKILFLFVWFFLSYLIFVVEFLSKLPLSFLVFKEIHWLWLVFSYTILFFVVLKLNKKSKLPFV
jgi:competence protein ComEC